MSVDGAGIRIKRLPPAKELDYSKRHSMSMPTTRLDRTGLTVSRLAPGTMNFGLQTEEDVAIQIMSKAVSGGINFSILLTSIRLAADRQPPAARRKLSVAGSKVSGRIISWRARQLGKLVQIHGTKVHRRSAIRNAIGTSARLLRLRRLSNSRPRPAYHPPRYRSPGYSPTQPSPRPSLARAGWSKSMTHLQLLPIALTLSSSRSLMY